MHRIRCRTLFDITQTEVRHNFHPGRVPFQDASGQQIVDHLTWMRARNQQRNWETLMQLLSLRLQPQNFSSTVPPGPTDDWWTVEFGIEDTAVLATQNRAYGVLEQDCAMVPMLTGLSEKVKVTSMLIPGVNIVFEPADP